MKISAPKTQLQLLNQPWVKKPATQRIIKCFKAADIPFRFVGGCVRDSLLKRPVKDIDLCTPAKPDTIVQLFRTQDFGVYETGLAHGTVTVVSDHQPYEITTLRQDTRTDGRHAIIEFTDNWQLDAARRDFTFNAMSLSSEGQLYDYFDGYNDLIKGIVRFIGNPLERILEDHLRILRLFRFQAYYGKQPLAKDVIDLIKQNAKLITKLSGERIREEFFKIILSPLAAKILPIMLDTKVVQEFISAPIVISYLEYLIALEQQAAVKRVVPSNPVRRLASLFENMPEAIFSELAERLKLSNHQRHELKEYFKHPINLPFLDPFTIGQLLYDFGQEKLLNFILLLGAIKLGRKEKKFADILQQINLFDQLSQQWIKPVFPLTGHDLIKIGITSGPKIGELLNQVHHWWRQQNFIPNHQLCIEYLNKLIN